VGLETVGGVVHDEAMTDGKRWAGLLRAVNVGGRTLKSAMLKKSALDAGFTDVATLLASGNVVFTASGGEQQVRKRLEEAITADAGFTVEVLLRTKPQLQKLVDANPFADGSGSRVVVNFLDGAAPAGLADRLAELTVNEQVQVVGHEVWVNFVDGIGRSKLAVKLPALVKPRLVTGRNQNTVRKLVELL
jgi:uncharacterized protein (DUF1697 family)